jgi:hypothetical protein
LEAMDIVLRNNTFTFNQDPYLQLSGTAMGTKMAPTYATLMLGYLEKRMYNEAEHGTEYKKYLESRWKRLLDDCYILWDKYKYNLQFFHEKMNNMHTKLNFTKEESSEELPFLDILLLKEGNNIVCDIYHKPTDTFNYLPFKSCHPRNTKTNIPFTLAKRICTLVKDKKMEATKIYRSV